MIRAVVLAGGKGTRLAPYSTVLPKPLMPVGDMPILEIVLRQLKKSGFRRVTIAVGHLAELIEAFFGNGSKWGLRLDYSREDEPLGTAGPLRLVKGLNDTFLVMNGDLLTTLDYRDLVNKHKKSGAIATLAVLRREVKIDLGIIETDENNAVKEYIEKPILKYDISSGIYAFTPVVLRYIPAGRRFDLPDLIRALIQHGHKVNAYRFTGSWLDIGRPDDYTQAVEEFRRSPRKYLGL